MHYDLTPLETAVFFCLAVPADALVEGGQRQLMRVAPRALRAWYGLSNKEARRIVEQAWPIIVEKAANQLSWERQSEWTRAMERLKDRYAIGQQAQAIQPSHRVVS